MKIKKGPPPFIRRLRVALCVRQYNQISSGQEICFDAPCGKRVQREKLINNLEKVMVKNSFSRENRLCYLLQILMAFVPYTFYFYFRLFV